MKPKDFIEIPGRMRWLCMETTGYFEVLDPIMSRLVDRHEISLPIGHIVAQTCFIECMPDRPFPTRRLTTSDHAREPCTETSASPSPRGASGHERERQR